MVSSASEEVIGVPLRFTPAKASLPDPRSGGILVVTEVWRIRDTTIVRSLDT